MTKNRNNRIRGVSLGVGLLTAFVLGANCGTDIKIRRYEEKLVDMRSEVENTRAEYKLMIESLPGFVPSGYNSTQVWTTEPYASATEKDIVKAYGNLLRMRCNLD